MSKWKALVLDDEEDLTFLLSSVLEFNQFEVVVKNIPGEAVTALRSEDFDILITDYKMDDMDGMQVIEEVRIKQENSAIKIILLTFRDLSEAELDKLAQHNVVYLKKPFLPNELVIKIQGLFA